jgi:hypothetical protein
VATTKASTPSRKPPAKKRGSTKSPPALLPPPSELERTCKGLATLDAMMAEDWEDRYYSFNNAWNEAGTERMASMRNGEGDEWFIVFAPGGVFIKAFWHEYPLEDVEAVYAGLPKALAPFLKEHSFSMEDITFGGWHDGTSWTLRGNAKPMAEELKILSGDPKAYRAYAADYFEEKLPLPAIAHVLAGNRLHAKLVAQISTERNLAELEEDLAEIGY